MNSRGSHCVLVTAERDKRRNVASRGLNAVYRALNSPSAQATKCVLVVRLCPTLCDLFDWGLRAPVSIGFSNKNTGVGCHFLLQGIFTTQGLIPQLLHCRQILYPLSHQGSHSWDLNLDLLDSLYFPALYSISSITKVLPFLLIYFYLSG